MQKLVLVAPLKGWAAPLDEAPDPVFAERMLGEGVLIDPLGDALFAPASGEIVSVHDAKHAVALRCDNGAEILMHVGIDTVKLAGAGFTAHVRAGDRVKTGDKLLSFDLDALARGAKSLVTPIIVTNGEAFAIAKSTTGKLVEVGDVLMEITGAAAATAPSPASGPEVRRALTVPLAHGLHARPAARIAELAKSFSASVSVQAGARQANAKSPVSLLSLALRHGDALTLVAQGADAKPAVDALSTLISSGMGEGAAIAAPALTRTRIAPVAGSRTLRGVAASTGLAIGRAFVFAPDETFADAPAKTAAEERAALDKALAQVRADVSARAASASGAARDVMQAHAALLGDAELVAAAERDIAAGSSAAAAWRSAIDGFAATLRTSTDRRLAERADDLVDLRNQVLRALTGNPEQGALPSNAIVVAEELLPSQFLRFDTSKLAGLCLARGGRTSHVAILAAEAGVPMLVAVGEQALAVPDGADLILDAGAGEISVSPDAATLLRAQTSAATRAERRAVAKAVAHEDCRMADGTRIEIAANLASVEDARRAADNGAEACGLLRTEFLFMDRPAAPDEDEQARAYQAIASALAGKSIIVRTLDIGADKPASFLPLGAEENPALGQRGVRVSLAHRDLLQAQLRAILRVTPAGQCRIMVPMVTDVAELRAVRVELDAARAALNVTQKVDLGLMIETPAAALIAEALAEEADFFSVGANDLTQYTLAIDRDHDGLAARLDALHPAVLRLIDSAAKGARAHGRWVGVCGGVAADHAAAPILIGLGVTELSAPPAAIPELKALVRRLNTDQCAALAHEALMLSSADAVRARAKEFLEALP